MLKKPTKREIFRSSTTWSNLLKRKKTIFKIEWTIFLTLPESLNRVFLSLRKPEVLLTNLPRLKRDKWRLIRKIWRRNFQTWSSNFLSNPCFILCKLSTSLKYQLKQAPHWSNQIQFWTLEVIYPKLNQTKSRHLPEQPHQFQATYERHHGKPGPPHWVSPQEHQTGLHHLRPLNPKPHLFPTSDHFLG